MTTNPSISQARRAARVRKVVEEVMVRRAGGGTFTDAQIIEEHPGLMPDLASELQLLALLERAQPARHPRAGSSAPGSSRDGVIPIAPDAFEGYEVVGEIHRGGQGVVYEATQKSTGRRVAVKVMREGLFGAAAGGRDSARFEREVRILGQLDHPGIVGILASGVHAGHFYYVMDYITGLPLDEYAARRTLRERLQVFVKVCEAVSAPHLRGIIHRDLKPANILVDEHGQPHILDFGLARITAEWRADPRMTQTGQFVGSLPWSSPEQAAGNPDRIDIRTDVYSLGVLLYQALAGRFPYRVEGGPRDVLDQILTASPARMRSFARGIDDDLEAVAFKCLAKERERRYQSAGELADDLRRVLDHRPVLARSPGVGYQVRSYMRRHTALVAGSAAVAATLVVGLIGTTVGLLEASAGRRAAEGARDTARDAKAVAETRLEEARRLAYIASLSASDSALRAQDAASATARLQAAPAALRDWEWEYLSGRIDQSLRVLPLGPVFSAEVAPGGETIATFSRDGTVRLLDARTLAVRWQAAVPREALTPDEQRIACFSRDGDLLATVHGSRVLVWRIGERQPITDITIANTTWGFITAAIDPDSRTIVVNGRQRRMAAYDLQTGAPLREAPSERVGYAGADFSPDGRLLAVGSSTGPMILDGHTGATLVPAPGAVVVDATIWPVRISADGTFAAIAQGSDISVLSLPDGARRSVLRGHFQSVTALALSPDGRRLASAGWDRTVRVWDLVSGAATASFIGHTGAVNAIGFLADGTLLTSAEDGAVRLWDPNAGTDPPSVAAPPVVFTLTFADRGSRLFTYSHYTLHLLDMSQSPPSDLLTPAFPAFATALSGAISHDGHRLAISAKPGTLSIHDLASGVPLWSVPGQSVAPIYIAFGPGDRLLATAADDQTIRLWDAPTGAPGPVLSCSNKSARPPIFTPDGAQVASLDGAGITFWDCQSGRTAGSLDPQSDGGHMVCVAFTQAGDLIATGDSEGRVAIWDGATHRPLRSISGMQPTVWSVAFNPSGTRLAAGSQDRTIRILDPRVGEDLLTLRAHTGSVMSLAWTPDGRTLASGSYDGTVRLWTPRARGGGER